MAVGDIIVGIDVGTSKICTVIGRISKLNQLEIIGYGISPNSGMKKGIIVDIENTAQSIKESVTQAEYAANLKVHSAYINIIGTHIGFINSKASVSILNPEKEISYEDIENVLKAAKDIEIPIDMQLIDIVPNQFIVDGYDEIIDPVGMVGSNLEVEADVVIGTITSVQNLVKSLKKAGLAIDGIVVEALATGEAVLNQDEKELGVLMLDVGAGTTDISVFKGKRLIYNDSLPIGGEHISK